MHTEHDAPDTSVNPEAVKLGHEPDTINIRTILYVPVALVITFALAYGTVTLIIGYMRFPTKDPGANARAVRQNEDSLDKRLGRISSDPNEKPVVHQPRLDGLERLTSNNNNPPFVQSTDPTKDGNSPSYHPEDYRPSSELGKKLGLQDYGVKDKDKGVYRIPVAEAMKLLAEGANDKGDPAAKKLYQKALKFEAKVNPDAVRASQPTAANPFWGIPTPTKDGAPEAKGEHH